MDNTLKNLLVLAGRLIFLMITGIAITGLGAYLAFLSYQTIFYIPNVKVPSVLNMEIDAAQKTLHQSGLKIEVVKEPLFREGDRFFVVNQNPAAGTEIKKNRTVKVEIRETEIAAQIPDLIGKTLPEAEALLSENGFQVGDIAYSMHHQFEQGKIIAQTPRPGDRIQENGAINILVSKGIY